MVAHMSHMASWSWFTWILFGLFLLVLAGGIVLAARRREGSGGDALGILQERLARGEISPEEYRERAEILGLGERRATGRGGVAVGLVLLGVVGILVVAAAGPGSGGGFMTT